MHIKHNLFYILLKEKKLFQKSKQNEHFLMDSVESRHRHLSKKYILFLAQNILA